MSKNQIIGALLALGIFLTGTAFGLLLNRSHLPFFDRFEKRGKFPPGNMLARFSKDLKLNEAQKVEVSTIIDEHRLEMDKLSCDMRPKMDEQMNSFRVKIRAALDEGQRSKFDKILAKHEKRKRLCGDKGPQIP